MLRENLVKNREENVNVCEMREGKKRGEGEKIGRGRGRWGVIALW